MASKAYYQVHKVEYLERGRKWRTAHLAERLVYEKNWRDAHRTNLRATQQRYRATHRDKDKVYSCQYGKSHADAIHARHLKYRHGISGSDYIAILVNQGGVCKICGATEPGNRYRHFLVDHDHATGAIRGLLCSKCNVGLANFREDRSILASAALYLQEIV